MDATTALRHLARMVAKDEAPCLSPAEMADLLALAACPDTLGATPQNLTTAASWDASTFVATGSVVKGGTNRYWRAVYGGTTGTVTPSWPTVTGPAEECRTVADGNEVVWVDNGPTWSPTYDLNLAAATGWEWKANAAANRTDVTSGDVQVSGSQIVAQCERMAARYRAKALGSIPVAGRR